MQRNIKGSDLSKKKNRVTVYLRELSTFIDTKIPTTSVFVYISYFARALDAWRGMTLRRELSAQ